MATPAKVENGASQLSIPLNLCMEGASINLFTGEIGLPKDVTKTATFIERHLSEMRAVFSDSELLLKNKADSDRTVHRIYRYIGDTPEFVHAGLKYDITVILSSDWGLQLPTTTGHYHLSLGERKMASPDFYQLVYGDALAILQRETPQGTEVKILHPKLGEWMLFPPQYAHSTVNIGNEPAIFANICVRQPHLNYEPIISRGGMAYYVLRDRQKGWKLERNPKYEKVLEVQESRCDLRIPALEKDMHKVSFYWLIRNRIDNLKFLSDPDHFVEIFEPDPIQPRD